MKDIILESTTTVTVTEDALVLSFKIKGVDDIIDVRSFDETILMSFALSGLEQHCRDKGVDFSALIKHYIDIHREFKTVEMGQA